MKINRTQDANSVPDWAVKGSKIEAIEKNNDLLRAGVDRINATASSKVDGLCLFSECEQIEKCASSGQTYYFNSTWSDSDVSHLREYASVCGLKREAMVGVDPTSMIETQASSESFVKLASAEPQVSSLETALKDALGDPFHIEERTNMSHMEKENWERITPSASLLDNPTEAMKGGILPLRGGEDTRISNTPDLPSNQNSMFDPDAIKKLNESEVEDTGVRLARERKEREDARANKHSEWEQEKIAKMQADNFQAQGVVFPTEMATVGSGVSGQRMGAYSDYDLKNLPEKTAGEKLAAHNEARKASIQREASPKDESNWDEVKSAPSRMISDVFAEELRKSLG
jgi:hypothetical protein